MRKRRRRHEPGRAATGHRENPNQHIAFSHGIYFCLGVPLARLDARIAFELLTQRLPNQRFEFDPNMAFRGPKELWAEWTLNKTSPVPQ